jgi:hypothetical protein
MFLIIYQVIQGTGVWIYMVFLQSIHLNYYIQIQKRCVLGQITGPQSYLCPNPYNPWINHFIWQKEDSACIPKLRTLRWEIILYYLNAFNVIFRAFKSGRGSRKGKNDAMWGGPNPPLLTVRKEGAISPLCTALQTGKGEETFSPRVFRSATLSTSGF